MNREEYVQGRGVEREVTRAPGVSSQSLRVTTLERDTAPEIEAEIVDGFAAAGWHMLTPDVRIR